MIVTIDGPAGAGKSSVARSLAEKLGYEFLDTGSMYRAVVWAALQNEIDLSDEQELADIADELEIEMHGKTTIINGRDVSSEIRTSRVTRLIFNAADNVKVRSILSSKQRALAAGGNVVTEGRDQGTVVFPDAECKIFLTASADERAQRRLADLVKRGENTTFEEVLDLQNQRDFQDRNRTVGRLLKAEDAIEVCTDGLTAEQVLKKLEKIVRSAETNLNQC